MSASDVPISLVLLKIGVLLGGGFATTWLIAEGRYAMGATVGVLGTLAVWWLDRTERRLRRLPRATTGDPH